MSDTLKNTAKQLADIMMTHLSTLDPQDRSAKIAAGKKVLKGGATVKVGATSSAGVPSDKYSRGTSNVGTVRRPLAARGR